MRIVVTFVDQTYEKAPYFPRMFSPGVVVGVFLAGILVSLSFSFYSLICCFGFTTPLF